MDEIYDRDRDFVSFNNFNKSYFDLPKQEAYGFFNPKKGVWQYELIEHNAFSLKQLNNGGGTLYKMCIPADTHIEEVKQIIEEHCPEAEVTMYYDIEDWISDKEMNSLR